MTLGYYFRDGLRWLVLVFIGVAAGVLGSISLSLLGLLADFGGFVVMPMITAVVAILMDRHLPKTKA